MPNEFVRVIAIVLGTAWMVAAQVPRFEKVQNDLFATGGAFTNAWADYDGDRDLDQFVGFDGIPNRLYRNDKGRFVDIAAKAGVADARPTRAAAWGDADGDGDADLLVGFADAPILKFYRNDKGVFIDATVAAGVQMQAGAVRQLAWVDFDGDGDLDVFVAFRDRANTLFRNVGGRFADVAAELGLADPRRTVGAVWFDHDDDGDLDVIVGNMDGDANGLFSQADGRFTDVAATAGVAWGGRAPNDKSNGTVRPCVADVDSDGMLDLFFANYGRNGLFLNRAKGRFEDVSAAWGIDIDARYDSCAFADMDNDGDLDLYVNGTITGGKQYADYLFRNTGAAFEDVTPAEIGSPNSDHGVQWVDFNLDGAMDLSLTGVQKDGMHWLLRNTLAPAPALRALHVRLLDAAGRATLAGRSAAIRVTTKASASARQTRLVDGGSGYNSQNEMPLHIVAPRTGLATILVTVRTADGKTWTTTRQTDLSGPMQVLEYRIGGSETGMIRPVSGQDERVVPVHEEPRHRLVFDSPGTRVLDVQIPPGDTTLFHTHSDPILYVTMSTSRTRSQNLGGDWSAAPGAPVPPAAPGAPSAPSSPPGRMMSTTSYAERPLTHRVNNIGTTLFRLIGITNSSPGDDDATDASAGFDIEPEIANRWFRGYRRLLTREPSPEHRHANPVVLVLVSGSAVVDIGSPLDTRALTQLGAFAFVERDTPHVLRADGPDTAVVEVEIRRPR